MYLNKALYKWPSKRNVQFVHKTPPYGWCKLVLIANRLLVLINSILVWPFSFFHEEFWRFFPNFLLESKKIDLWEFWMTSCNTKLNVCLNTSEWGIAWFLGLVNKVFQPRVIYWVRSKEFRELDKWFFYLSFGIWKLVIDIQ